MRGTTFTIALVCGFAVGAFLGHLYGWWGVVITVPITVIMGAFFALLA
jgi:hypothetical protein